MKESQLKTLVKAIIREALADDLDFTKDHHADLSTQMLIRLITQAEKARGVPHKDLTKMDSGQLQKYYNSIEKFDDSVYVPGHGWGGVREEADKKTCQKCKGQGHYTTKLKDLGRRGRDGVDDTHIVSCDAPGCKNGKVDPQAYYDSMGVKENSDVCSQCNGSGEGPADGTKCLRCKGSGSSIPNGKLTKHTDPDYDWDKEDNYRNWSGIDEDVGGQHLINGQSNVVAASRVNKILSAASKGLFSDNSWEAINNIFKKLSEAGLDVTVTSAKYGGHADTGNDMPKFKEWQISIPFTNKNGKQVALVGNITAHGAGSLEQPLDRYDITAYVSPSMVKPS